MERSSRTFLEAKECNFSEEITFTCWPNAPPRGQRGGFSVPTFRSEGKCIRGFGQAAETNVEMRDRHCWATCRPGNRTSFRHAHLGVRKGMRHASRSGICSEPWSATRTFYPHTRGSHPFAGVRSGSPGQQKQAPQPPSGFWLGMFLVFVLNRMC